MPIVISVVIFLFSHLTTDKSFPETMKGVAYGVFIVLCFLYLLFGVIF